MEEGRAELTSPCQEKLSTSSREQIFKTLYNPAEITIESQNNGPQISTITGFTTQERRTRRPIHYIFFSPQNPFQIIRNKREALLPDKPGYVQVNPGEEITYNGERFQTKEDPWGNLYLTRINPHPEANEVDPAHEEIIEKIVALWESAIESEEALGKFQQENIDPQVIQEIEETVTYLEEHPELQRLSNTGAIGSISLSQIDPWELAQKCSSQKGKKESASFSEKVRDYLRQKGVHSHFFKTDTFKKILEITQRISQNENFTPEDITFLNALASSRRAMEINIHTSELLFINDITRRYAIANLVENYLARQLLPEKSFTLHQRDFQKFIQTMKSIGEAIPPWFTPYRGEEFTFGPAIGSVMASAYGNYFFSLKRQKPAFAAAVLNHERIHSLTILARTLSHREQESKGFRSEESFTEAFSLLVRYQGDAQKALQSPDIKNTSYEQAVRELLKIIDEINQSCNPDKPMLGTRLMLRGITAIAKGEIGDYDYLLPLEKYYNQNKPAGKKKFRERMAPFSDQRITRGHYPPSLPHFPPDVSEAILKVPYEEVKSMVPTLDPKSFQEKKELHSRYPDYLLFPTSVRDEVKEAIFHSISNHPSVREKIEKTITQHYRQYLEAIKGHLTPNEL